MSDEDEFIVGRGYMFQGQWLGNDPAAFNILRIRTANVQSTETCPGYVRLITHNNREYIIFSAERVRAEVTSSVPLRADVIDVTPATPKALTAGKKRGKDNG